ncbi:MAG: MBL fold metallo-hydrolase [Kiritimatiellae bacterium]|nr:MBL fold metallo-hydrolase [Kiritimatiellia bacterium]
MKISFFGAAQNVTGSNYLLDINGSRVLVDCGYYQERDFRSRNHDAFQYNPIDIDAVLLTHAHLDHSGLLPKLVKHGFKGKIFCTEATADIAKIIMYDSAHIQEEDIKHKKKRHAKQNKKSPYPYEAIYRQEDVDATAELLRTVKYNEEVQIVDGLKCTFNDAGHILGASMLYLKMQEGDKMRTMIFSGDMGRPDTPILCDPTKFEKADYVVIESTYGNRVHKPNKDIPETLARIINQAHESGGNVVVPSFAVERSQELLFHMHNLLQAGRIPKMQVYLDSPMAVRVTEVFRRHPELFDEETSAMLARGEHPCDFPGLMLTRSVDESKAIAVNKEACIIIAGSGMCTGGRIKHHIKHNIEKPESTLMFVGYQAAGTLGRTLLGAPEKIRIHGEEYKVAARIEKINGFSAHADRNELFAWISALTDSPRRVFVTHGETEAAKVFGEYINLKTGWDVSVPEYCDEHELD